MNARRKSNQEESRQHNTQLVLHTIFQAEAISRVAIARQTGLTRTTVSDIVAGLLQDGLVTEVGPSASTGGKPAILLSLQKNARLVIGLDLAEDLFRGALVNLRGEILQRAEYPIPAAEDFEALALLESILDTLIADATAPLLGIGIGVPGLLDAQNGVVRQAVNLNWQDFPLRQILAERYALPVHIANDCQVAALGETTFKARPGLENLILVKAGRGVGAGVVLGGKIFFGDQAGAGEIGHIQIDPAGAPCRCGRRGCLETLTSSRALLAAARDYLESQAPAGWPDSPQALDLTVLRARQQAGDPWLEAQLARIGAQLGQALAYFVSLTNINQICIAGELSRFGPALADPLAAALQAGVLPALGRATRVGLSALGDDIVILGAAAHILKTELGLF